MKKRKIIISIIIVLSLLYGTIIIIHSLRSDNTAKQAKINITKESSTSEITSSDNDSSNSSFSSLTNSSSSSSLIKSSSNSSAKKSSSSSSTKKSSSSSSTKKSSSSSSTRKSSSSSSTNQSSSSAPSKTQEQINDELRKSIQNQYGVTIKYGNEMGDYKVMGYTPTKLMNPNEIYENLGNIKTHVAYYPVGFFKEMKDYGMPLTIYLVKNLPGSGIAGAADKEFYSDIKITVCTDQFFFRVFHHEVYHYVEAYMEIVGYNNGIFNNWDDLNPQGFSYGSTNSSYSYSLLDTSKSPYFINDYGQTNCREDRATIFEDLMARAYETTNSFVSTNKIWDKGKMICEEIDRYFNTVNSWTTERWERFIYN